ncbi:uncharacterized protein LOC115777218 [Archocentrus centrarchus]|uniref:uncharacterized protein LOC115777218 n=1 Tax=Archocentrus centrarchus TaxID=63155 RepID=UPI0011E9C34F|nr:uncharacterized protein LOC115777218 [Archocentrus centrarchus]
MPEGPAQSERSALPEGPTPEPEGPTPEPEVARLHRHTPRGRPGSPGPSSPLPLGVRSASSPVSLSVSPNLQQFFSESSSVSLSCVDGWTVRRTRGGLTEDCGAAADFKKVNSSSCLLDLSVSSDGSYFCVNPSGQQSDGVSFTVSDKGVILEIPALPVRTGSDVTLRCKPKDGSRPKSYFFRDGGELGPGPEGEWILSNVQKSDEGLYKCSTDIHPSSPQSRLRVRDSSSSSSSSLPLYLLVLPVVLLLVLVLVLVGGVGLWRKQRGTRTSPPPLDVTYADVNITQKDKRRAKLKKHPADTDTVYSGVRTHTAGPADITYGQIVIRAQRPARMENELPPDPDVVYSSVRAGT